MVFVAIFAPWIAPQNPNEVHLLNSSSGPSSSHWLGADSSGRDILSRLIYGARLSLLGPLFVIVIATVFGVPMGLLAGYKGGVIDGVLSRAGDVVFAFPPLLLAIVIVATFGTGFRTAVIAVSVTYVPLMARVVRSATLIEREKPYVDACRVQGFGVIRTCARHIAPSLARLINSQLAVYFAYSLLDLAALSFLGLGTQPPHVGLGRHALGRATGHLPVGDGGHPARARDRAAGRLVQPVRRSHGRPQRAALSVAAPLVELRHVTTRLRTAQGRRAPRRRRRLHDRPR